MLSLKQPLESEIEIEGKTYQLDLSFDNVLRWYELMSDDTVNELGKVQFAFMMFVLNCPDVSIETQISTVQAISEYISGGEEEEDDGSYEAQKEFFNFEEDAGYIYASFLQEYGIDLIDMQGKLRWEKFIALLNGLRDNTKFNQIIAIRAADLPSGNSEMEIAERKRLLQLKSIYELKSDKNVSIIESEMNSMFDSLVEMAKKGGRIDE